MPKTFSVVGAAAAVIALGLAVSSTAYAQADSGYRNFAHSTSGGPKCPPIEWHVLPIIGSGAGVTNGVAYYSDMSGVSVIKGTLSADGTITGTVTSVYGNGPAGTISGKRDKTMTHVDFEGPGCSHLKFDLRQYVPSEGGG